MHSVSTLNESFLRQYAKGAGEMPQTLRALTAIPEHAGFIPRTSSESQDNIQTKHSQISNKIRFLKII